MTFVNTKGSNMNTLKIDPKKSFSSSHDNILAVEVAKKQTKRSLKVKQMDVQKQDYTDNGGWGSPSPSLAGFANQPGEAAGTGRASRVTQRRMSRR